MKLKTSINTRDLMRQINRRAKQFGESNQTAVARWGVATCRELIKDSQVWGTGSKAKKKQEMAMFKDANRAIFSVTEPALVRKVKNKTIRRATINGQTVDFTQDRILSTTEEITKFIESHRSLKNARVPKLSITLKGIASARDVNNAVKQKSKSAGKAKGGWIGGGLEIGRGQKEGSRITIGKNFAGYAHKHANLGKGYVIKSMWSPSGVLRNKVPYVSSDYVLKKNDIIQAVNQGGKRTRSWYNSALKAKLAKKV
jgi:hypothetical protein